MTFDVEMSKERKKDFALTHPQVSCGGSFTSVLSGTITSPGWPDTEYPDNLKCTWNIELNDSDKIIRILLHDITLETAHGCEFDSLVIW